MIRAREAERAEDLYLAGVARGQGAETWLVRVPKHAEDPDVSVHRLSVSTEGLTGPLADWLVDFLQSAGERQARLIAQA